MKNIFFFLSVFIFIFMINVISVCADEYSSPVTADILNTNDNMSNINGDNYYVDKNRKNYKYSQKNNKLKSNKHKKYPQSNVKKSETKESPKWWRLRGSYFGFGTQFD